MSITTENLTTTVRFGLPTKGNVAISTHKDVMSNSMVIIQELSPNAVKTIGDKCQNDEVKELPKIILDFQCVESIDVLIENLKRARLNIEYPYGILCLAC